MRDPFLPAASLDAVNLLLSDVRGAATSGLVAGMIVDRFGYAAAFLTSGAVATVALAGLACAMPETAGHAPT